MHSIRDTNVAVVGGAGFIGSHVVDCLIDRGCAVLVIDNLVTGRRKYINRYATFEHADITGPENYLLNLFKHYHVRYVFNYAAEPYIPVSFSRPLHVFNVNAFGALKVINAAQEAGCEGILQVSSAEIYGNILGGTISEDDPVEPHSTYGASKAAIDSLVQVRWRESKTPVIALRQFNCVGPRETHPYVIPEIISQLYEHPSFVKLGNNSARDFQYVKDAAAMAVELLEKGDFGEVYNMGSETCIEIYDLAKLIGRIMTGKPIEVIPDQTRVRPWEIWHLCSDNNKLYHKINTRPQTPLEQALIETVRYFHANGSRWDWKRENCDGSL